MPWENFVEPRKTVSQNNTVTGSGPGRAIQNTPRADSYRLLPANLEYGSGSNEQPAEVAVFAEAQISAVRHYAVDQAFWLPDWVRQHIDQNGTPEALVQKVIDRVKQNPHEETLLEAQIIFNELGRSPKGTATVRRLVSSDVIRSIAQSGHGGK